MKMTECGECGGEARVVQTEVVQDVVRRRWRCRSCGTTWMTCSSLDVAKPAGAGRVTCWSCRLRLDGMYRRNRYAPGELGFTAIRKEGT